MREIKFRAWDKLNKNWVTEKNWVFIRLNGTIYENEFQGFIEPSDRYEITQFTGLRDKNGKDIYEGDVLENKVTFSDGVVWSTKQRVIWYAEQATFGLVPAKPMTYSDLNQEKLNRYEVIGNIYESPDLMSARDDLPEK